MNLSERFKKDELCFGVYVKRGKGERCKAIKDIHINDMCGYKCPFYKSMQQHEADLKAVELIKGV
jgi:hypothetical protein